MKARTHASDSIAVVRDNEDERVVQLEQGNFDATVTLYSHLIPHLLQHPLHLPVVPERSVDAVVSEHVPRERELGRFWKNDYIDYFMFLAGAVHRCDRPSTVPDARWRGFEINLKIS